MKFGKCSTCGFTTALLDFKNPEDYMCPNDGTPFSTTTTEPLIAIRDNTLKHLRLSGAMLDVPLDLKVLYDYGGIYIDGPMIPSLDECIKPVSGSASVSFNIIGNGYLSLTTGITNGSRASIEYNNYLYKYFIPTNYDKVIRWKAGAYLDYITNVEQIIGFGSILWDYTTPSPDPTLKGCRFKIINDAVYGSVGNDTAETTLSLGTTLADHHIFEIIFKPAEEARFYIDGGDRGAITSGLPSGEVVLLIPLAASVTNTAAEDKSLRIKSFRYLQEA